jgi:hypothetical protein
MLLVPHAVANFAVRQLAHADYSIATKISEDVAVFVPWALDHQLYWASDAAITLLQELDKIGGIWISIACWLVLHTHP